MSPLIGGNSRTHARCLNLYHVPTRQPPSGGPSDWPSPRNSIAGHLLGSALNANIHFHILFLDGVYVDSTNGSSARFRWVKGPTRAELTRLTQTLALRIGRFLERQGQHTRDAENGYLAGDTMEAAPIEQLLGSSITYRIAVGPHQGRKVFTMQTVPACDEPFDDGVRKVAGLSLHGGVAARAEERKKVEQLRRYISRPTVS